MREPKVLLKERPGARWRWRPRLTFGVMQLHEAVAAVRKITQYSSVEVALFYNGRRITQRVWLTNEWAEFFGTDTYGKPIGPTMATDAGRG